MEALKPYIPFAVYLLGAAVGVFLPYFRKWVETGEAFDWRKAAGKLVAAVLGLLILPTLGDLVGQISGASLFIAFGMGLALTFAGYEAQKTPGALRELSGGG